MHIKSNTHVVLHPKGEKTEVAYFLRKSIMTTNFTALHELVHLHTSK